MKEEKKSETKSVAKTKKMTETKTKTKTKTAAKAEVKPEAKPETETKVKSGTKPKAEAKPKAKAAAKSDAKPETKSEPKPETKAKAKTKKAVKAEKEAEPEATPVAEPEAAPVEVLETATEAEPETKSGEGLEENTDTEVVEEAEDETTTKRGKKGKKSKKSDKKADKKGDKNGEKPEKKSYRKKNKRFAGKRLEHILDLNASNVWNLDEYTIAESWERIREEEDFSISEPKLLNIIRLAYEIVHYSPDNEREVEKYENGGWAIVMHCKPEKGCVAIRRKTIERITDLSYENIRHISAAMLLELISRNFGGGWDAISLSIRDIIESGFEISTTQLPASRIHAPGSTLEKKVAQGFEVLEIPKGTWVEAIFAKKKDPVEKIRMDIPDRMYDEDGNVIPPKSMEETTDELPDDTVNEEDDTYFSSLTPEANPENLEDESLNIEDVGAVDDE